MGSTSTLGTKQQSPRLLWASLDQQWLLQRAEAMLHISCFLADLSGHILALLHHLSIVLKDKSVLENGNGQCKGLGCIAHSNFKKLSLWN